MYIYVALMTLYYFSAFNLSNGGYPISSFLKMLPALSLYLYIPNPNLRPYIYALFVIASIGDYLIDISTSTALGLFYYIIFTLSGILFFEIFHLLIINYLCNLDDPVNIYYVALLCSSWLLAVGLLVVIMSTGVNSLRSYHSISYNMVTSRIILIIPLYAVTLAYTLYLSIGTKLFIPYCLLAISDTLILLQLLYPLMFNVLKYISLPLYWIGLYLIARTFV